MIMGIPPISASGLPGKREDAYRAGMMPIAFMDFEMILFANIRLDTNLRLDTNYFLLLRG